MNSTRSMPIGLKCRLDMIYDIILSFAFIQSWRIFILSSLKWGFTTSDHFATYKLAIKYEWFIVYFCMASQHEDWRNLVSGLSMFIELINKNIMKYKIFSDFFSWFRLMLFEESLITNVKVCEFARFNRIIN